MKLILPNGFETDNEKEYEKEWNKIAKELGKELGLTVKSVHGQIVWREEYSRKNGGTATTQLFSMPHELAVRIYDSFSNLKEKLKETKDWLSDIEWEDNLAADETPQAASVE
jgi:hypothetical protein